MYYHALMYMPLADAAVLNAAAPVFSALMAIFMLSERVGAGRWLLILLGFAGVVVIIRPGYQEVPFEAVLALGSAALFALAAILNKRLVGIESGTSIVYGTNFVVAVCGLFIVLAWGVRPSWVDLGWMLPSLYSDRSVGLLPMDDWLERLGILGQGGGRRDPMTNALMLARLFQMVLVRAINKEILTAERLVEESQATVFLRRNH